MTREEIKDEIQSAWNEGDNIKQKSKDTFGDFLDRAAEKILAKLNQE